MWKNLRDSVLQTAEEILGEKPRNSRNHWFDEECVEAIKLKNDARQKLLSDETRKRARDYRESRRNAKKLL